MDGNISIFVAFIAGLLSFLSPCVLPLLPAYITYLTGSSIEDLSEGKGKWRTLYKSIAFVIGFSIVFILMGVSITSLGQLFINNQKIFRWVGGILIIIFGIHTTGIFKIKFLYTEKRLLPFGEDSNKKISLIGAVFMGMAFAAGWTPCVGPILGSILFVAGNMETIGNGVLLLVFYSLGLAIPFILTALAIKAFMQYFRRFSKYLPVVSMVSGIFLILMGLVVLLNKLSFVSRFFEFMPKI